MSSPEFNMSSLQNTNGLSNTATGLLADNQRAFFKVQIPTNLNACLFSAGIQHSTASPAAHNSGCAKTTFLRMPTVPRHGFPHAWCLFRRSSRGHLVCGNQGRWRDRVSFRQRGRYVGALLDDASGRRAGHHTGLTAPFFGDTGIATTESR